MRRLFSKAKRTVHRGDRQRRKEGHRETTEEKRRWVDRWDACVPAWHFWSDWCCIRGVTNMKGMVQLQSLATASGSASLEVPASSSPHSLSQCCMRRGEPRVLYTVQQTKCVKRRVVCEG